MLIALVCGSVRIICKENMQYGCDFKNTLFGIMKSHPPLKCIPPPHISYGFVARFLALIQKLIKLSTKLRRNMLCCCVIIPCSVFILMHSIVVVLMLSLMEFSYVCNHKTKLFVCFMHNNFCSLFILMFLRW